MTTTLSTMTGLVLGHHIGKGSLNLEDLRRHFPNEMISSLPLSTKYLHTVRLGQSDLDWRACWWATATICGDCLELQPLTDPSTPTESQG